MASNVQLILDALIAGVTPQTPSEFAEDAVVYERHRLLMLVRQKLEGRPDAQQMIDRYLEEPSVWQEVLADALVQSGTADDPQVVELARETLSDAQPLDPEQIDPSIDTEDPAKYL